jgi:hypothetical protein
METTDKKIKELWKIAKTGNFKIYNEKDILKN